MAAAASDEREVKKRRVLDWHTAHKKKDKCSYHSITDHEKSYDAVFLFLKALKKVVQQFGGKHLLALLPRVRLEDTILSDVTFLNRPIRFNGSLLQMKLSHTW